MVQRSILFPGGGITLREMAEIAREFDRAGFHGLYTVEAYRSGFVPLAVLAQNTDHCRVGTYILNAHARAVVSAAMAARDVDDLSGGRTVIGVGSGNPHINEWHLGASNAAPLARMREYVGGLRAAVAAAPGEQVEFVHGGRPIRWSPAITNQRSRIPVLLAAMYPRMRQLAGEVADGIALGSLHSAAYVAQVVRPAVLDAVARAGRNADEFQVVASQLASVDEDREAARSRARRGLCRLFTPLPHPYYEYVLREQGWSQMVDAISVHMTEGRLEAAMEEVSDDAVDDLLIAGDPDTCEQALARYQGVLTEVVLTDATSVGASIDPATQGSSRDGLRALLSLAPSAH